MPRVTDAEHYRRHQQLHLIYAEPGHRSLFGLLSFNHQLELHRYYQPQRIMTRVEFRRHSDKLAVTAPSLVNRAGKHFGRIEAAYIHSSNSRRTNYSPPIRARHVATSSVRGVRVPLALRQRPSDAVRISVIAHAEPDPAALARAFLMLAEYQRKSDKM